MQWAAAVLFVITVHIHVFAAWNPFELIFRFVLHHDDMQISNFASSFQIRGFLHVVPYARVASRLDILTVQVSIFTFLARVLSVGRDCTYCSSYFIDVG
jgi:hypothetical protein